ncbi:ATP-dependent zinc metalloprotease FtsH [Tundrisphaera sp. TA3]|uniref:ATP-dependent zinc metalloprotease FtsH n=1 Tax=Tundrisphaera sp. TA3 TaxID=3435775 RepID=UPI003EBA8049
MDLDSQDRSSSSHAPSQSKRTRQKYQKIGGAALALLVAIGAAAWYTVAAEEIETIRYGTFKEKLIGGQIRSARIGPTEIDGEFTAPGPDGSPARFRTSRLGMELDRELPALLANHIPGGRYEAIEGPSQAQTVLAPLAVLAIAVGILVFMSRKGGGLGSAMAFARSRHKVYGNGEARVTFDQVAGNDEVVAELREVVDFLRTPEKFQKIGGRIPKGVLLVGPPGTGKTLLAKAVAGEAGVPFFSLSGSDFVEMFVGVGAARVRNLFAQAEAKAPCLVFIDELDALGKSRGAGGPGTSDERDQTLNQLLVAMDGFSSDLGVIVMAATNRPETLDAALVRPGRFDRNITVDRPDIAGREEILRVHTRKVALEDQINLRHIAAMTPGFVGADLANLVNEATLLAARKNKTTVGRVEFEEGVERVVAGPEKKQRVLRPDEKLRIAYHEAGHAIVSRSLPHTDPVHKVSILGRGNGALGYTMYRPEDDRFLHTQSWLENTIRGLLGGTVAEELVYGEVSDGATSDLQRATSIARKMVAEFGMSPRLGRVSYQNEGRSPFLPGGGANSDSWSQRTAREIDLEVRRVLDEAYAMTRAILGRRRLALEDLTTLLIEQETIDAQELQAVLDRHPVDLSDLMAARPAPTTLVPPPRTDVPPFRVDHVA